MSLYDLTLNTPKPWLNAYVNQITCQAGPCGGGDPTSGSFTANYTFGGGTPTPTPTPIYFNYVLQNNIVFLISNGVLTTINGAQGYFTISGIPNNLQPSSSNSTQTIPIAVYGGSDGSATIPTPGAVNIVPASSYIFITKTMQYGNSIGGWSSGDSFAGWAPFVVLYNVGKPPQ